MAVSEDIKNKIFNELNITDSRKLDVYDIGKYIEDILKLTQVQRTGHDWFDVLTSEKTVEFLIQEVEEGVDAAAAFDKIKSLNGYQISLHKEFGLSKDLIKKQYRIYTTTTCYKDLNFMRTIPKSWNKEDAFESIKGNDKHQILEKITKIRWYKKRFKESCNASELCLSKLGSVEGLFNMPGELMKNVTKFLIETPEMVFNSPVNSEREEVASTNQNNQDGLTETNSKITEKCACVIS